MREGPLRIQDTEPTGGRFLLRTASQRQGPAGAGGAPARHRPGVSQARAQRRRLRTSYRLCRRSPFSLRNTTVSITAVACRLATPHAPRSSASKANPSATTPAITYMDMDKCVQEYTYNKLWLPSLPSHPSLDAQVEPWPKKFPLTVSSTTLLSAP